MEVVNKESKLVKKILFMLLFVTILTACNNATEEVADSHETKTENNREEENNNYPAEIRGIEQAEKDEDFTSFIDKFNELTRVSDEIDEVDIADAEDDGLGHLTLHKSPEYEMRATYDSFDERFYYSVIIFSNQPYDEKGKGYEALLLVAEALNLNTDRFIKKFEESLTKPKMDYIANEHDNERLVMFNHWKLSNIHSGDFGIEVKFRQ